MKMKKVYVCCDCESYSVLKPTKCAYCGCECFSKEELEDTEK